MDPAIKRDFFPYIKEILELIHEVSTDILELYITIALENTRDTLIIIKILIEYYSKNGIDVPYMHYCFSNILQLRHHTVHYKLQLLDIYKGYLALEAISLLPLNTTVKDKLSNMSNRIYVDYELSDFNINNSKSTYKNKYYKDTHYIKDSDECKIVIQNLISIISKIYCDYINYDISDPVYRIKELIRFFCDSSNPLVSASLINVLYCRNKMVHNNKIPTKYLSTLSLNILYISTISESYKKEILNLYDSWKNICKNRKILFYDLNDIYNGDIDTYVNSHIINTKIVLKGMRGRQLILLKDRYEKGPTDRRIIILDNKYTGHIGTYKISNGKNCIVNIDNHGEVCLSWRTQIIFIEN